MTTAHIILLIAVPTGIPLAWFCRNTARLFRELEEDKRRGIKYEDYRARDRGEDRTACG